MKDTSSMMYRYFQEMRASGLAGHQNRLRSSDNVSYKHSTYMRRQNEVGEEVLCRAGRYQEVAPNLPVKESLLAVVAE
jgi:hypothetical protein